MGAATAAAPARQLTLLVAEEVEQDAQRQRAGGPRPCAGVEAAELLRTDDRPGPRRAKAAAAAGAAAAGAVASASQQHCWRHWRRLAGCFGRRAAGFDRICRRRSVDVHGHGRRSAAALAFGRTLHGRTQRRGSGPPRAVSHQHTTTTSPPARATVLVGGWVGRAWWSAGAFGWGPGGLREAPHRAGAAEAPSSGGWRRTRRPPEGRLGRLPRARALSSCRTRLIAARRGASDAAAGARGGVLRTVKVRGRGQTAHPTAAAAPAAAGPPPPHPPAPSSPCSLRPLSCRATSQRGGLRRGCTGRGRVVCGGCGAGVASSTGGDSRMELSETNPLQLTPSARCTRQPPDLPASHFSTVSPRPDLRSSSSNSNRNSSRKG